MTSAPDRLLRRLEWQLRRRVDGRLQGAYRTVWRGAGIDFTDLRQYTPDDDVRHIDWNVTARLDEPYVRQYTEDRELTAWMVVDRSASMRFGSGKYPVGTALTVALARLLAQGGNRVGAILYDNASSSVVPPRTGRNQVLRLARELSAERAGSRGAVTDLAGMLRLAASTTSQRRSLVFVVSDFIGDPGWDRPLTALSHRHEVVVLRIVDPVEFALPDVGVILVEDAETGEQVLVDTSDPLLRKRLQAQFSDREDGISAGMRKAAVTEHRISTDVDVLESLVRLVRESRRRR
ncbi:DUF58 domain-containing protein [Cryptosporangium phraense]|uniref:DUF58 domain-containing protein n=1 Tax=Cryptosporangium phraense TaxID=2593070 RepID=A0A545ATV8_9ACTN|nr:DUF58 domain-containing protein [Cryptosporangium phraense]TQS44769.1 DUF58 domain-containing protein [Cryptosporangium phraense]